MQESRSAQHGQHMGGHLVRGSIAARAVSHALGQAFELGQQRGELILLGRPETGETGSWRAMKVGEKKVQSAVMGRHYEKKRRSTGASLQKTKDAALERLYRRPKMVHWRVSIEEKRRPGRASLQKTKGTALERLYRIKEAVYKAIINSPLEEYQEFISSRGAPWL